jgi:hypothetical protein
VTNPARRKSGHSFEGYMQFDLIRITVPIFHPETQEEIVSIGQWLDCAEVSALMDKYGIDELTGEVITWLRK